MLIILLTVNRVLSCFICQDVLSHLRKEIQFLKRVRHPDILRVIEVLPESGKVLAFVTEAVGMSLANVRKDFRGIRETKENANIKQIEERIDQMNDFAMSEFEITSGLLNVTTALQFLHKNKMIHSNLCPENIWLVSSTSSQVCSYTNVIALF